MKLIINKPVIKDNKLISKIEYDNKTYDLFFQVEDEYREYLCDNNCNSFLIALLPFIVKHNYDVEVRGKISSKLYYQLMMYLIPMLCTAFDKHQINIDCELTNETYNSKGVGASISCGVDSFYTLFKHQKLKDKYNNITHLCFFNAGSNGKGEKGRNLFKTRIQNIKKFCLDYNYNFVTVDTNINELIMMGHEMRHTFTTLSCVYALEKLFKIYYFASGFGFDGSHIDENDTAFYDVLNTQCLSNENITFYCSGMEATRMDKIKYISNFSETYNWLNVCIGDEWNNCGKCKKCIRTMTALESIGKLDHYKNVFDLNYYYNNKAKILSTVIIGNRDKIQHEFYNEILKSYKQNKIKIPIMAYILSLTPSKENIKLFLKNILPQFIIKNINKKNKNIGWRD